ncbi:MULTISPECIES: helix-turn-helix transcriptional regulator [unclassified Streptomyces]|uniref:helix-turn-helix transcriptional regulator n=1 Tax=unclassified Streptomyces TaxID=2593676 RepID=UPI0021B14A65|nr:helix-turn-helix transcriptional regulator [Streptomyces sp. BHT-5-2]
MRLEASGLTKLSAVGVSVYELALNSPAVLPASLPGQLGKSVEEVEEALGQLSAMGLLCPADDKPGMLTAVSPDSAAAQTLFPMEQALRDQQSAVTQVRAELERLRPLYATTRAKWLQSSGIEILQTLKSVRSMLTELGACCTTEMLTSQPGGGRPTPVLEEAIVRDEDMLRRGVKIRTLYQHTARYNQPTVAYVERVAQLGAEVRTLSDGFARMIVFDRKTAVISYHGHPHGGVLVHDQSIVDFAVAAFERTWLTATPFSAGYQLEQVRALSSEVKQDIMRLLVSGLDDRAIARRLGMGLRSCQRHIAEIMDQLGARSRLHAGYLIGQSNLLGSADPDTGAPAAAARTAGTPEGAKDPVRSS